jgi:hypothetical protein
MPIFSIRHFVLQVRPDDTTVVLGEVDSLLNAPTTTDDATVYCIKSFALAGIEVWVRDHLGNWWRHPEGNPLTHWKRD